MATRSLKYHNVIETDEPEPALIQFCRCKIDGNGNVVMLFTGDPGTGKTYDVMGFGEAYDPTFGAAHMFFDLRSLAKFLGKVALEPGKYRGTFIVYEEPQEEQTNKRSFSYAAVQFTRILSTFRSLNCILAMTTPRQSHLTKDLRDYVDIWATTTGIDRHRKIGYAKVFIMHHSETSRKVYKKFLRVRRGSEVYSVPVMGFRKPNQGLADFYEAKKLQYLNAMFKRIDKNIERREQERGGCPECGTNYGYWAETGWNCRKCGRVTIERVGGSR